jgi:TatD DNase family protein
VYRTGADLQSEVWHGLVDTHCHLDLEPIGSRLPELLDEARKAGVTRFVVPGVHPDNWERILNLATQHEGVYPAFGIHPMHAETADIRALSKLAEYAPLGVAVGEIGLDPAYAVPMEQQERAFRNQLRFAVSSGLPVLVHCRKAFQNTIRILKEEHACRVGGIMHAFSGSPEMAKEFIRLGFAISISGTVTWERAFKPARLVRELPLEHLVLETDAPDLTPQPFRGEPNRPALLREVLKAVAGIRAVRASIVALQTQETSQRILNLLPDS